MRVTAKVRLFNPRDPSRYLELELPVDTGNIYTWIKHERLEGLGIRPSGERKFRIGEVCPSDWSARQTLEFDYLPRG